MIVTLLAFLFGLTITFAGTASAQTGKPAKVSELAAYAKDDREKMLYSGAKTEGKITWYTSLAGGSYKELASVFESKYPGVKVEAYRATSQELMSRVIAESQARRFIVDTLESTIPLLRFMRGFWAEHRIAPDVRHVVDFLVKEQGFDKKRAKEHLFRLFPYGYVKQACKIAGMRKPRVWSTG